MQSNSNLLGLFCTVILFILISFHISTSYSFSTVINVEGDNYADYIIYNGTIITVDPSFALFDAIAIKGSKIIALGTTESILNQYGLPGNTKFLNLNGKAVLPGWIDGHSHIFNLARFNDYGILGAQDLALSYGYTSINEKFAKDDVIDIMLGLEASGDLKMRINMFASYDDSILDENNQTIILQSWFPAHDPILNTNHLFRIPGIKIFMDGAFVPSRGAWAMSQPMPEQDMNTWLKDITTNPYGDLYFNTSQLIPIVSQAQDMGYSVAFHSMGDRAIETVVEVISNVTNGSDTNYRHQIEHSSYLRPDLLQDYVNLDMTASVRGYYPTCDSYAKDVENFFSPGYFNKTWYVNRYNMSSSGVNVYLETDFAWTYTIGDKSNSRNLNPYLNLFGLVTRAQVASNGTVCQPESWMNPDKISLEDAIRIMTIEGARAVREENATGSLEVGKYADLIIVPISPFDIDSYQLKDLYTLMTMVGGNVEYTNSTSGINFSVQSTTSQNSRLIGSVSTSNTEKTFYDPFELVLIWVIAIRKSRFSRPNQK